MHFVCAGYGYASIEVKILVALSLNYFFSLIIYFIQFDPTVNKMFNNILRRTINNQCIVIVYKSNDDNFNFQPTKESHCCIFKN